MLCNHVAPGQTHAPAAVRGVDDLQALKGEQVAPIGALPHAAIVWAAVSDLEGRSNHFLAVFLWAADQSQRSQDAAHGCLLLAARGCVTLKMCCASNAMRRHVWSVQPRMQLGTVGCNTEAADTLVDCAHRHQQCNYAMLRLHTFFVSTGALDLVCWVCAPHPGVVITLGRP